MTTIHRLLDESFAGIEPTPEVLDLKEEIRANLEARAAELEATGVASDAAAQKAVRELGDIRELVGGLPAASPGSPWGPPATEVVRPKPAYVARVVLASAIAAVALAVRRRWLEFWVLVIGFGLAVALVPEIKAVLGEAIAAGGSTLRDFAQADGALGYFQHRFRTYDREGQPCRNTGCKGVIGRQVQAGRSTFYCPVCQK